MGGPWGVGGMYQHKGQTMRTVILLTIVFMMSMTLQAQQADSSLKVTEENGISLAWNTGKYQLLATTMPSMDDKPEQAVQPKSSLKAAVLSAVLPGSGELYAGSYWKAAIFAAVEVAVITGYFIYENKGDDEDWKMRNFGDQHWSEQKYWSYVYNIAVRNDLWNYPALETDPDMIIQDSDYDATTVARLREIERNNSTATDFTHSLPETKTQQYYEMIYKYLHQFGAGWDDVPNLLYYEGQSFPFTLTPNISEYRDMRNRSNDFYQTATTMFSVAMLNHLISAFDAALTVKRNNKKLDYAFRVSAQRYAGEMVRTYGIHFSW